MAVIPHSYVIEYTLASGALGAGTCKNVVLASVGITADSCYQRHLGPNGPNQLSRGYISHFAFGSGFYRTGVRMLVEEVIFSNNSWQSTGVSGKTFGRLYQNGRNSSTLAFPLRTRYSQ